MLEDDWKFRRDGLLLRDALCEYLEEQYGKVRFFEEKTIGKVRADIIAVVNDGLYGIEIKSHSDSYARLSGQIRGYDKFCDRCFLCVGDVHIHAAEHVPDHWGILSMTVHNGIRFTSTRPAQKNPKSTLKNQLSLLWKNELSDILRKEKMPRYPGQSKKFIYEKLIAKVPEERLKMHLCDCLFERDYTRYDD